MTPTPRPLTVALVVSAASAMLASVAAHHARADRARPEFPATVVVGPSPGAEPMARGNVARTGQTTRLPDPPHEVWHRKIRGGLSLAPAVDARGAIVVAAAVAEVVQVSPDGAEQWHHPLGMSVSTAGPVILSDDTRMVVTALGDAWGFGPDGSVRFQVDLSHLGADPQVAPLPRDNGHVVLAIAAHLVEIDARGRVADQVALPERVVGMLLQSPQGVIATGESGKVYAWSQPHAPRVIGAFGGQVREGAVLDAHDAIVAVVDASRLVRMDPNTGATTTLLSLLGMESPPAIGTRSTIWVTTAAGSLIGMSGADEAARVPLHPAPPADADPDAGSIVSAYLSPSPPVVTDHDGRVAFVRSDGRVGVVDPSGAVHAVEAPACGSPIALVAAGDRKFLVACKNGSIKLYGPRS